MDQGLIKVLQYASGQPKSTCLSYEQIQKCCQKLDQKSILHIAQCDSCRFRFFLSNTYNKHKKKASDSIEKLAKYIQGKNLIFPYSSINFGNHKQCSATDENELMELAFADGEIDEKTEETIFHLFNCRECAKMFAIKTAIYGRCYSDCTLRRLYTELVCPCTIVDDEEKQREMISHVVHCPLCRTNFKILVNDNYKSDNFTILDEEYEIIIENKEKDPIYQILFDCFQERKIRVQTIEEWSDELKENAKKHPDIEEYGKIDIRKIINEGDKRQAMLSVLRILRQSRSR